MPPPNKPKVKIKITSRFTDEQGGRLFGPGIWDVDPAISMRLIANGKATLVEAPTAAKGTLGGGRELKPPLAPANNPRVPPAPPQEPLTATPLPEDFPSRDKLVSAGIDTVEHLQAPDVKKTLTEVEGLTPAEITKIGLAISKA